tara:strand:+ start:1467 stop:1814 length:348 start_codon:yes stop_codon:yes gene_type:complete
MPVSNHARRLLLDTLVNNINEMVIGYDGSPSTNSDGAAGRPAYVINPNVKIIDDNTILVEGFIPVTESFNDTFKEVFLQNRNAQGVSTPIARHTITSIKKSTSNEIRIQVIIEVK